MLSRQLNSQFSVEHAQNAVTLLDGEARDMVAAEAYGQGQLDEALLLLHAAQERAAGSVKGAKPADEAGSQSQQATLKELRGLLPSRRGGLASPGLSVTHTGRPRPIFSRVLHFADCAASRPIEKPAASWSP